MSDLRQHNQSDEDKAQESNQFQNNNLACFGDDQPSDQRTSNEQNQGQGNQPQQKLKYYKQLQNTIEDQYCNRSLGSSYNFGQNQGPNQQKTQFQYQQHNGNQIKYDNRFEQDDNRKRNETRQQQEQNEDNDYHQDNYRTDYRKTNRQKHNSHFQKYDDKRYQNYQQKQYQQNQNLNLIDDQVSFLQTSAQKERYRIKAESIPFEKQLSLKEYQENYGKSKQLYEKEQNQLKQKHNLTNLLLEYTLDDIENKTQEQTDFSQRAILELHEKQDFIYLTDIERQQRYEFKTKFHRLKSYSNQQVIREQFPCLRKVNLQEMPQRSSVFVLIRCGSGYNNIHKAIKYGIWTSKKENNEVFSDLYKQYSNVYLIFLGDSKIETETNLFGIARLLSDFESQKCFLYWERDCQHLGIFHIEWLYVKTLVPSMVLASGYNSYRKQQIQDRIQLLRDGTILDEATGNSIFQQFNAAHDYPSLFDQFNALDILEDQLRFARQNDSNFKKQFERMGQQQITNRYIT